MLGVVHRGTAKTAIADVPYDVYGKTGTTNESKHSWFVGFSDDIFVGAYVKLDEPTQMGKGSSGGSLAAPIVSSFMDSIGVEFDASPAPLEQRFKPLIPTADCHHINVFPKSFETDKKTLSNKATLRLNWRPISG
jgi:penicillin-binding protein 1A